MPAKVLQFIAWVLTQVWRWGKDKIAKAVNWTRANWRRVANWIASSVAWQIILEWIMRILGLN